jgi:hypothetical protein
MSSGLPMLNRAAPEDPNVVMCYFSRRRITGNSDARFAVHISISPSSSRAGYCLTSQREEDFYGVTMAKSGGGASSAN